MGKLAVRWEAAIPAELGGGRGHVVTAAAHDRVIAELRDGLVATNRALGGALLILRAVRDREPVGSCPERVAQECEGAQQQYFATRAMLGGISGGLIDAALGSTPERNGTAASGGGA